MAAPINWRTLSSGSKIALAAILGVSAVAFFLILSGVGITLALHDWNAFNDIPSLALAWPRHLLLPIHAPKESQWLSVSGLVPALLILGLGLRMSMLMGGQSLHGDAVFANSRELKKNKLRGGNGIMVGWTGSVSTNYGDVRKDGKPYMAPAKHLNASNLITFSGSEHLLLTAPTRGGKGVGIVQPNLLTWQGSAVTLDMKGENHRKTAGYRHACGQEIFVFDPVHPEGKTHRWNPLAYVRRGTLFQIDDLQRLASFLYPPNDKNPFFDLSAQAAFVGVAGLIAESGIGEFTVGGVYRVLSASMDMKAALSELLTLHEARLSDGTKSALRDFLSSPDNTMMNIRATITSRLGLFLNPLVDAATSENDFDFSDLRRKPISIYMTITPDNLLRLQPLINLFFQQCLDVQMRDGMPEDHPEMRHKVLYMLDEFPAIGQIQVLKKANAFVAQYGLRMIFVVQALSQLVELYGEMGCESLVKNCGMEVIFPPNHQRDAEELSDRLGFQTVKGRSETSASGRSTSESVSDQRRALMLPQELLRMSAQKCLITRAGMPVILANKIRSYAEPSLVARMAMPPPPVSSIRVTGPASAIVQRQAVFRAAREQYLQLAAKQAGISSDIDKLASRIEALPEREIAGPSQIRRADVVITHADTIGALRAGLATADDVLREMRPASPAGDDAKVAQAVPAGAGAPSVTPAVPVVAPAQAGSVSGPSTAAAVAASFIAEASAGTAVKPARKWGVQPVLKKPGRARAAE